MLPNDTKRHHVSTKSLCIMLTSYCKTCTSGSPSNSNNSCQICRKLGCRALKIKNFPAGACPRTPLRHSWLCYSIVVSQISDPVTPLCLIAICLMPMISRRSLFTILRLNYIVNQATLIKVKDRCAKFTSRLPSLISPPFKTWSKLSQKFG